MKKIFSVLMLAAALPLMVGCRSDDVEEQQPMVGSWPAVETVSQKPQWELVKGIPKDAIQGKPDWQWNDQMFRQFSKDMTAILALESEAVDIASPDDRMAAIVNGQVRFVAEPVFDEMLIYDEVEHFATFYLYVPFETGEDAVDIQYYNAKLNSTFTRKAMFSVNDDMVGNEELEMLYLFPKTYYSFILEPNQPFICTTEDRIGIFADNVCCGIVKPIDISDTEYLWPGRVYDDLHNGKVYVRYYSDAQKTIYTTQITLSGIAYDDVHLDFRTK